MTPHIGQHHLAATINGKTVDMLIDSSSDLTIVSEKTAKCLGLVFSPVARPVQNIVSANRTQVKMISTITDACIEMSQGYLIDTVWIADNLSSEAILGASSLSAFSALTIKYGGQLPALTVNNVTAASRSTFTTHPLVKCFTHMDSSLPSIRAPSRHHSPEDKVFIHNEILKLLHSGKIRPSHSSWQSQAFVMWEAGQKPRMVVDFAQTVNCITHLDAYPIPLVSDLLDQVSQYRYFSYIDLKAAFHQFHLDPTESHFTAFEADNHLWEFTCIPFGLCNSPAAFNCALQNIIGSLPGVVIYMDNVVVGGRNLQEHNVN